MDKYLFELEQEEMEQEDLNDLVLYSTEEEAILENV